MHIFLAALLGLIAFLWALQVIEIARGIPSLPHLKDVAPAEGPILPKISVLVAARDEEKKLPEALASFLALDYPNYEVVAVNDRSQDGTQNILDAAQRANPILKTVRIETLPDGWLGKPHALQQAYRRSSGEWLVFTDADVYFAPDVLRRAIALNLGKNWDHLTLLGRAEMFRFFEKIAMTFFGFSFVIGTKPWRAHDPKSRGYMGVGAFQMVRRSSYEQMGTHERLRMEVIDDMKLGKLMKEAGFASGAARAGESVSVHWHDGVRNIVRGTTKNFFATSGFSVVRTLSRMFGLLLLCVFPVCALPFARGWALAFCLIAVALPMITHGEAAKEFGASRLWGLSLPIGALIFVWMLGRSMVVTLWQGGIEWRGTFYRLKDLKSGIV
ncbi:MAG TPA: glycosyltransferase family 2 protein [Candidatus Acidoferrales bacterium]|nr:glycosyltransferase family 2 protein [Candidatus Acidoferrales bacterium]